MSAFIVACVLACGYGDRAVAAINSISLVGPHLNKFGTPFRYTVKGTAAGVSDDAYAWEAPYSPSCASSYRAESKRKGLSVLLHRGVPRNRRFSFVLHLVAFKLDRHRLCAYIADRHGGTTLARAEASWRNFVSSLQPAPVGSSECAAKSFPDGSVYAQIAISGMTCEVLEQVAFGADAAKGAAYSRVGFSCTAIARGAGSKWESAWTGTYYSYSCVAGNELAAFNWGPHFAYVPPTTLKLVKPGG
jgi:hypothetical protein